MVSKFMIAQSNDAKSKKHAIYIPDADLQIPLQMWAVISAGFSTRLPTQAKLDDFSTHIELTSEEDWDPNLPNFSSTEEEKHDDAWKTRRGDSRKRPDQLRMLILY